MIRWKDGADHYTAVAQLTEKWTTTSGSMGDITIVAGAYGGQGLQFYGSTTGKLAIHQFGGNESTIGFAAYLKNSGANNATIGFRDSSTAIQLVVDVNQGSGQITVYRGNRSTQIGQSVGGILPPAGSWYHLEIKIYVHDSLGYVEVRVNTVQRVRFDGDTRAAGADIAGFYIGTQDMYTYATFDHIHIWDTTGGVNDDWLGDVKIVTQLVSGDGTASQWTRSSGAGTHASHVDDTNPNDDTDYLSSSASGLIELFTHASLTSVQTIKDVGVTVIAKKTDVGTYTLCSEVRSGGSNYDGGVAHDVPSNYFALQTNHGVDPATAVAWLVANFNAAEFGFKHLS